MNKEQIYDRDIFPLMGKVLEICQANKIAMLATFSIPTPEDDGLCCTSHTPDETGKLPDRIAACVQAAKGRPASSAMITMTRPDGSKTMTAVIG